VDVKGLVWGRGRPPDATPSERAFRGFGSQPSGCFCRGVTALFDVKLVNRD